MLHPTPRISQGRRLLAVDGAVDWLNVGCYVLMVAGCLLDGAGVVRASRHLVVRICKGRARAARFENVVGLVQRFFVARPRIH